MNELVCSTYKLIQIHIPKTGGSSIQRFIYGLPRIKAPHRKSLQILENISRYKDYFTFAVVRNPLDRIISTYFYYTTRGGNRTGKDKKIGREFRKRGLKAVIMDLENLHRYIPFYEEQLSRVFLPQHYYTHKNNRFVLNKIFYYERLFECFAYLKEKYHFIKQVPHTNKSRHKHYREYFDNEMRQKVYQYYEKDFAYFYKNTGREG